MGGSAFAQAAAPGQPTLRTPRMSRAEYESLKTTYLARLKEHFPDKTVSVLVEAPEKTDYGDLDLIVKSDDKVDTIHLARTLGARGVICSSSGKHQMCSIGVLKDGSRSSQETVIYKNIDWNTPRKAPPSTTLTREEYAQIDIQILPSEDFHWHAFYCSYGDLGGLLGNVTRNLGFTVSDKGLILRLKELDYAKKQKLAQVANEAGMLCLSNDPDIVMKFLGLNPQNYAEGFKTVEDLFSWVGECRLIDSNVITKRNISRDRQKENKRTLYSTFFHEWLPERLAVQDEVKPNDPDEKPSHSEHPLWSRKRDDLCREAIDFFDKRVQYDALASELRTSTLNIWAESLLRPLVMAHSGAKDKKLAEIMRAFRRRVGFNAYGEPYVLLRSQPDFKSKLFLWLRDVEFLVRCDGSSPELADPDKVNSFVQSHWEELKALERARAKAAP